MTKESIFKELKEELENFHNISKTLKDLINENEEDNKMFIEELSKRNHECYDIIDTLLYSLKKVI